MAGIQFFFPGQKYLVAFGGVYILLVALLAIPYFQSQALYLNNIKLPLFADFNTPEKYGLAPNRTVNLQITTPDAETIGAWFVFSNSYYSSLPSVPTDPASHIPEALSRVGEGGKRTPVVLFFHGNAATRAFSARIRHYQAFTSRLGAHVLAIDYRGFADSSGSPSEKGLTIDARAAFDWLVKENGVHPEDVLVVGHSLGTGVAGQLAAQFDGEDIKCRGFVLLSPFSSITEVLETYNMFGFIPLMKPLYLLPGAVGLVRRAVVHRFDTLKAVPNITASVLIAHALDDWDISHTHSDVLFQAFIEPHLPPIDVPTNPILVAQPEVWAKLTEQREARQTVLEKVVTKRTIDRFGSVDEFVEPQTSRKVTLVKTLAGGHDYLGVQEGLIDIIGRSFDMS